MTYRWKIPDVQANFVDPQGVANLLKTQNMSGYAPADPTDSNYASRQMRGYAEPVGRSPARPTVNPGTGYQFDSSEIDQYMSNQDRMESGKAKLSQLQARLAEVENKIAEIDAQYPELKNSREWDIAAKRAEIGDMSAYDSLMNRGAGATNNATGIENGLYNAGKLLYGLDSKDSYEQGAYANQIEMEIRRADEWKHRNPGATMPPIYYDIKNKYETWKQSKGGVPIEEGKLVVNSARETTNQVNSMVKNKKYSKETESQLQEWVDEHPNDPNASEIQSVINANRFNTVEARASAEAKNKARKEFYESIKDLSVEAQEDSINAMTDKDRRYFYEAYEWKKGKNGKSYIGAK